MISRLDRPALVLLHCRTDDMLRENFMAVAVERLMQHAVTIPRTNWSVV